VLEAGKNMLQISNVIIANQDINSFSELCLLVKEYGKRGERFLTFDVKPPYTDTPDDWEDKLEISFTSRY